MTLDELRRDLGAILTQEEQADVDWEVVQLLSEQTYVRLTEPDTPQDFPHEDVIGYLAGFNRRRDDHQFGAHQRRWLRTFLRA